VVKVNAHGEDAVDVVGHDDTGIDANVWKAVRNDVPAVHDGVSGG
jgi:hypothetical protein